MWEKAGLIRDGKGLAGALSEIADLAARADLARAPGDRNYNLAWQNILDVRNQLKIAELIVRAALERDESRGSHYRTDCPEMHDDGRYNIFLRKGGDGVHLERRPVRFTRITPQEEGAPPVTFTD